MEQKVFKTFADVFAELPKENGLYVLSQLLGRLSTSCPELEAALKLILADVFKEFPDQVMWNILDIKLRSQASHQDLSEFERANAKKLAQTVDNIFGGLKSAESTLHEKYMSYLELGNQLKTFMGLPHGRSKNEFNINSQYPQLNRFLDKEAKKGRTFLVPLKAFIVPALDHSRQRKVDASYETATASQMTERHKNIKKEISSVNIMYILNNCQIMSSLQRPVKFTLQATNGRQYSFLAKTGDDLALDARVSELIQTFDYLLRSAKSKQGTKTLSVRSFFVVPLGHKKGLIEWVDDLASFKSCVMPLIRRQGAKQEGAFNNFKNIDRQTSGFETLCKRMYARNRLTKFIL